MTALEHVPAAVVGALVTLAARAIADRLAARQRRQQADDDADTLAAAIESHKRTEQ